MHNICASGVFVRNADLKSSEADRFVFFGFSESNLKEGQLILIRADEKYPSRNELLQELGRLDEVFEKNGPGKYAARLGMAFTSTIETIYVRAIPLPSAFLLY